MAESAYISRETIRNLGSQNAKLISDGNKSKGLPVKRGSESNMKHKILIVTTVGGFLWQFEKNTIEILKEQQAEIHYAANFREQAYECGEGVYEKNGIILHPVSIRKSPFAMVWHIRALKELMKIIKRENIDTVHCHTPVGGVLGRLAAYLEGKRAGRDIKVLYTAHGFHFYKGAAFLNWLLYYPVEKLLARLTDVVITINREDERAAKEFSLKGTGSKPRIYRIPGVGVDRTLYRPGGKEREEVRRELGVEEGKICLMTAALLDKEKNYQTVLKALALLKKRESPKIKYVICGEGPYRRKLERLTHRLGLEETVVFCGFRKDMYRLLQGTDGFVFPSVREGLGMAALEAMACGLTVIAMENRGTREYMRHGENGFLIPHTKQKEMEKAFKEAIAICGADQELRARLGRQARKDTKAFDKKQSLEIMRTIYHTLWEGETEYEKDDTSGICFENERHHERVQPVPLFTSGKGGRIRVKPDLTGV